MPPASPRATVLSGAIAAPLEQVFAVLSDPARIPEWLPGCRTVNGATVMYQGAWLDVTFGERTTTFHITDFHPPFSFAWAEHGARTGSRTVFQIGFAAGTTSIRMQHFSPEPKAEVHERRDPQRRLDETLQNLRRITQP